MCFSLYTNKPRDTRDKLIEKMRCDIVQPTIPQQMANTAVAPTIGIGAGTEEEKIQWMKMYEEKLGGK